MRLRRAARIRSGQTLLELIAATTVIGIALVPSLRIMGDSVRIGRETEMANLMATLSASKLEEYLVLTAVAWETGIVWNTTTVSDNFGIAEYPQVRFTVVRTDATAAGGIPGSLLCITSTVWEDENDNLNWDAGEPRVIYGSKLASSVAYQREASGT